MPLDFAGIGFGLSAFRVGVTEPETMTAGEINKELAKLDAESTKITAEMISAGRGHERPSETFTMTDPLALRSRAIWSRRDALRREMEQRAGPSAQYWTELPREFGRRRQPGS